MSDDESPIPPENEAHRRRWFDWYVKKLRDDSVTRPPGEGLRHRCPCSRFRTLSERGGYDICPVCNWEDDGQDDHDADEISYGPNGPISLSDARENYLRYGACEARFASNVRPPSPGEIA